MSFTDFRGEQEELFIRDMRWQTIDVGKIGNWIVPVVHDRGDAQFLRSRCRSWRRLSSYLWPFQRGNR